MIFGWSSFLRTGIFKEISSLFTSPTLRDYEAADKVGHFYTIDLLRGLAAITTIIWHYQHFYGIMDGKNIIQTQPFYNILYPIYHHGFWAVQAFWIISGFVFAHVYAGRTTTGLTFGVARLARLYPLHLITPLTIGAFQIISFKLVGHYQLVGSNGLIPFAENLLFIAGWGLPGGGNFNGPIWSVSVEIAIYIFFFFIARFVLAFGIVIPAFIALVSWLFINEQSPVNNFFVCAYCFFIGVSIYHITIVFRSRPLIMIVANAMFVFIFVKLIYSGDYKNMRFFNVETFLFIPIIYVSSMFDLNRPRKIKKIRWIGDSTYSIYLWHFPIQVLVLIIISYYGISSSIFNNVSALVVWVVGMMALSYASFLYLEKPAQKLVRRWCQNAARQPPRPQSATI